MISLFLSFFSNEKYNLERCHIMFSFFSSSKNKFSFKMNYSEFELSPPKLILNALPIISASPVLSLIELTLSSRV